MLSLEVDDGIVYYDFKKRDNPFTVVLLHGLTLDHQMWIMQQDCLAAYSVLEIDLRGHGQSQDFTELTVDKAADDVAQVIAKEKIKDCVLLGISLGGEVVQAYANRHGGARGYMVISATPIYLDCYTAVEMSSMHGLLDIIELYPREMIIQLAPAMVSNSPFGNNVVRQSLLKQTPESFKRLWKMLADAFAPTKMTFDAPLAVVYGALDLFGTVQLHIPDWKRGYPDSMIVRIEGSSHMVTHDATDRFNSAMLEFIKHCENRTS